MNKYNVVLFDMDGTIANTDELVAESVQELCAMHGLEAPSKEECYYFSGPPIRESLAKFPGDVDVEQLFKDFYKISLKKYDQMVVSYPNCRYVLSKLKEKGIKLGVVTNKAHDAAIHCLEVIGLWDIFSVVIGFEDASKSKPDPEGLLKATRLLGEEDLSKVLYVGDSPLDDLAAHNAGIEDVLCIWGPRKLPDNVKPSYKIYNYLDLLEVVFNEKI